MLAPMQNSRPAIDRLRRHGRPVVVLNYASGSRDVCTVLVDNEVGHLAARHLIEQGRTSIAFVAGMDELQPLALQRRGVKQAVAETGRVVRLSEPIAPTPCWPSQICWPWRSSASSSPPG